MSVFKPVDTSMNFPVTEAKILQFWKDKHVFEASMKARVGKTPWTFYEGPPTANGKPHPGHILTRVVKDLFPRYKTMCGYFVPRKAGWDTHGLPVEIEVEKELKLDGKTEVAKYGVEPFVRKCMDSVFRYTTDWETLTEKIGFWIDLKDAYVTYHKEYVESIWWSLKELHSQNLLYKGHKILPWCPHCQTALSSHEVGQGYQEVEDPSVFVTFRDADWATNKTSFLAWTTTPWTLPSNAGLALKSDTEYSYVKVGEETLIMASALIKQVMGKLPYEVVKTEQGSALIGRKYLPLYDWWQGTKHEKSGAWRVCAADFVTLDTGSGIVHMAPAFGADDYTLGRKEGLPVIQLVGPDGKFVADCGAFTGRFVKDADGDLIRDLKTRGLLLKRENYKHDYPFCWRCKSPLIYYARGGWFIRTTQEISHVIENNQKINWHPEHIKDGRFGSFLASNIDWALSRERYWGTPLPVWLCECGHQEALGSFDELKAKKGAAGLDAFDIAKQKDPTLNEHLRVHKPWIDAATFSCEKCGKTMKRTSEVIDCWYDSGAMPFAQWGYPHAVGSKEKFNLAFPADFISEAIDQTRGWFYSLIAINTLLRESFEKTSGKKLPYPLPYKTCLVLGHISDEHGKKLSKSNPEHRTPKYDANAILDEEGADALRWFFYSSNAPWNNARFSRPAVRESQKEFLIKLRNVYSFFVIYANIDQFAGGNEPNVCATGGLSTSASGSTSNSTGGQATRGAVEPTKTLLDRWVLSELHLTTKNVRAKLDAYDIFGAAAELNQFVEGLSNWYVRRSRERFWQSWETPDRTSANDQEKLSAYATLYRCLLTTAKLIAPFVPFFAEELWQNLARNHSNTLESVHLNDYPQADETQIDAALADEVALIREIASFGRAVRASSKLKTRQPLSKVIVVLNSTERDAIVRKHEQVLLDELNVKKIEIAHRADLFVNYELKPNFKAIGAKFRESVPLIKEALTKADAAQMRVAMAEHGKASLALKDGKSVELTPEEVEVSLKAKAGYEAASGKAVVVVLDTQLTPELLEEGLARELVSRINGWRSELKLAYEQRIKLVVQSSDKLQAITTKFKDFIGGETLCVEVSVGTPPDDYQTMETEVEGEKVILGLLAAKTKE